MAPETNLIIVGRPAGQNVFCFFFLSFFVGGESRLFDQRQLALDAS